MSEIPLSELADVVIRALERQNLNAQDTINIGELAGRAVWIDKVYPLIIKLLLRGEVQSALAVDQQMAQNAYSFAEALAINLLKEPEHFRLEKVGDSDGVRFRVDIPGAVQIWVKSEKEGVEVEVWSAPHGDMHFGTMRVDYKL